MHEGDAFGTSWAALGLSGRAFVKMVVLGYDTDERNE